MGLWPCSGNLVNLVTKHPAAATAPTPQTHELVAHAVMAALLLLSGNWFCGACLAAVLAYMLHLHTHRLLHVDTTDAFRQLPQQKKQRFILLGAHLLLFVLVVYRCAVQLTATQTKMLSQGLLIVILHEWQSSRGWQVTSSHAVFKTARAPE